MTEPPRVEITGGSPSPEDEEAIRQAVLALWREDQLRAARAASADPWVLAARLDATQSDVAGARGAAGAAAWRFSGRLRRQAESIL